MSTVCNKPNCVKFWGVMIIVVGDTSFLSRNKCRGGHWGPIQDGGRADMSAPIGSVSLWGVYIYYVYEFKLPRGASSLEQMRLLGHVNTKQHCEIESVWNSWIQRRTQAQEKHCVQRDSQKTVQSAHLHYLPWIYCSNTHCTMVLWQKMWDIHIEFYYKSNGI